jgi:POT family proton-dependent oligopeptide transporter
VVPPAGKAWLREVFSASGLKTIGSLSLIYLFVAVWWALWDQSNGQTWTLQAESSLMDKNIGFGFTILPAQIMVVNGLFILGLVPVFTFVVYPLWSKVAKVTPLRKITVGLLAMVFAFFLVGRIEARIQAGETVSVWWQILAYVVLTASEVLVSITALEFSYKQAPLRMKSFIMALFLLSISLGNLITAGVNHGMVRPLHADAVEVGGDTWVVFDDARGLVTGQKIDFDGTNGILVTKEGKPQPLKGTYLVAQTDEAAKRVRLMDVVDRKPVSSTGTYDGAKSQVSTYKLVGPEYFDFFAMMMGVVGLLFVVVAFFYKERTHLRDEAEPAGASPG